MAFNFSEPVLSPGAAVIELSDEELDAVDGGLGPVAVGAVVGAIGGALGYGLSAGSNGTVAGYFAAAGYGAIGGALGGVGGLVAGLGGTSIATIGGWAVGNDTAGGAGSSVKKVAAR